MKTLRTIKESAINPSVSEIKEQLASEGLQASQWSNDPGVVYASHDHSYGKILIIASGSITFVLDKTKEQINMKVGNRLTIPAYTQHSAIVGPEGVVCFEVQLDASDGRVEKLRVETT